MTSKSRINRIRKLLAQPDIRSDPGKMKILVQRLQKLLHDVKNK